MDKTTYKIFDQQDIQDNIHSIMNLFLQNVDHRHSANYIKEPLLEYMKFARVGFNGDNDIVYFSGALQRPEYDDSIRVISRHTRDVLHDWGGWRDDIKRGTQTLDQLTDKCLEIGCTNVWVSREEDYTLIQTLGKHSKYDWSVAKETLHNGSEQWVLRLLID